MSYWCGKLKDRTYQNRMEFYPWGMLIVWRSTWCCFDACLAVGVRTLFSDSWGVVGWEGFGAEGTRYLKAHNKIKLTDIISLFSISLFKIWDDISCYKLIVRSECGDFVQKLWKIHLLRWFLWEERVSKKIIVLDCRSV